MTDERPDDSRLDRLLQELHEELENVESSAKGSGELLRTVLADIRVQLEESGDAAAPPAAMLDRVRDAMDHFEESHPDVTRVLGRVVDALSNMGI